MLLCDRKGRGNEKKRREDRERGEGGINRKRSNKMKANGRKEARHNTMVKETLLSIPPLQARKNEDQSQSLWLLYIDLLKGGLTLISGLSLLALI